ncbi:MAG TPA: hypothetical protein VK961_15610 [Chthoniobacter sp.]|nr:hypothetical protein [Chthoniobacter sp.]
MNSSFYFQYTLHGICEWAAAFAIAFWISQAWSQNPAPLLVQWVRSPLRPWPMVAFGIAPYVLSLLLQPLLIQLYTSGAGTSARMPISYFLSLIYGVLIGLASSCCAAPAAGQQEFRPGPPAIISAVLITASFLVGSFLRYQAAVHTLGGIATALTVLFVARAIIGGEAPPSTSAEPPPMPVQRALWPALVIGFLPAALILGAIPLGSSINFNGEAVKALLLIGCIVSVVCCFTASIMLFKRHTGGAIAGGILLLLLNGFIAFFFGCCAAITNSGFR